MTSSAWSQVVLVAALVVPLAGLALSYAAPGRYDPQPWTVGGCAVSTVGATVLLAAGQAPVVGGLHSDELSLAAIAATAMLTMFVPAPLRRPATAAAVPVAGMALAAGHDPRLAGAVVGVVLVAVLVALTGGLPRVLAALVGAASIAAALGERLGHPRGAALVLVAATVVAVLAALDPRRPLVLVVPAALVLGLRVAPAVTDVPLARGVALALAAGGVALAWWPRRSSSAASIVPWAMAVAIVPIDGVPVAARALAAGAVLALTLGGGLALLTAVPGAAVVISALASAHGWPRAALAGLVIATVAGVARSKDTAGEVVGRERSAGVARDVAVLCLAGWLVFRPSSWSWLHAGAFSSYTDGVTLAAAAAAIVTVASLASGRTIDTSALVARFVAADDGSASAVDRRTIEVASVITAAMGVVAIALLRSARL